MKKLRKAMILIILIILIVLLTNQYVLAAKTEVDINDLISKVEYSKEFKNWLELSDSEKLNTIQPKIYDELNTPFIVSNPLYQVDLVGASISNRFSLKDIIESNVSIRNQYNTSNCWAFAGLSSLETNLALNNYKSGKNLNKVYDFSERHVNYATTRLFADNKINSFGFNRIPAAGGQWLLIENYLTNGQGAVDESSMPFEDNSKIIDISAIQNKSVETRVYDTIYFDNYNDLTGTDRIEVINKIKQHIQNYGSVFASIHGDSSDSINYSCYNNDTGAKYCDKKENHVVDHAVSIIGWDDNYNIDNFAEGTRPNSKGAWIVRNSWGENLEYDLNKFKKEIFDENTAQCIAKGWNNSSEIPNSFIEEATGYTISGDKLLIPVGDHGYMYVSYEDCNVGRTLYGIEKATDGVDYDYIYQYNELYPAVQISLSTSGTLICNNFTKQSNEKEYLTGIALTAPETYTCKVYVNPNGTGRGSTELQLVPLQAGESETISLGYHTLEFAEPVEIKSENFAVVVEVQGTRNSIDVLMEGKIEESDLFDYAKTETGKCFIASSKNIDSCTWFDLGTLHSASPTLTNGDSCLKAFTTVEVEDTSLSRIEIATPPTRVVYNEGEDFKKDGLTIRAIYNNDKTMILNDSDYNITNGSNLQYGQESVTITYMGKSVEQPITVVKKENSSENPEEPSEQPEEPKENPEEPKQEEKAVNSSFNNAKCTLSNIKAYYYNNDSSKNYTLIDTEINGITRNLSNDSYEYYYYLSPKSNLTNITDWVKIDENQTASDRLIFQVDSRKISNYDEISVAKTLYIYIKETVTKGGSQSAIVSKGIKYEQGSANIETYVDGAKSSDYKGADTTQGSDNGNNNNDAGTTNNGGGTTQQQQQTQGTTTSSTASPTKLPYTGKNFVVLGIIVLIILGLGSFIRYEFLNKYVK